MSNNRSNYRCIATIGMAAVIVGMSGSKVAAAIHPEQNAPTPQQCATLASALINVVPPVERRGLVRSCLLRTGAAGQRARRPAAPTSPAPPPPTASATTPSVLVWNGLDPTVRSVFISRDSINVLGSYAFPQSSTRGVTLASPLGASIAGSIDELKKTRTIATQGYFGACLSCGIRLNPATTFSIGGAIIADGSLTDPFTATSPIVPSALRIGLDLAANIDNVFQAKSNILNIHMDALPFYQTDFRGLARMSGVQLLGEPEYAPLHLASDPCSPPAVEKCFLGYSWRVIPEANIVNVDKIGQTFYLQNGGYEWAGASVQASAQLFLNYMPSDLPMLPKPIFLFVTSLTATVQYKYLVDANAPGQSIGSFVSELDYQIGRGKGDNDGTAAIALSFQSGKDELTLQKARAAKLSLTYKY